MMIVDNKVWQPIEVPALAPILPVEIDPLAQRLPRLRQLDEPKAFLDGGDEPA